MYIINMYLYISISRTQSHTSKYKLNFQDRNYKLFPFHVTFQISPLSNQYELHSFLF